MPMLLASPHSGLRFATVGAKRVPPAHSTLIPFVGTKKEALMRTSTLSACISPSHASVLRTLAMRTGIRTFRLSLRLSPLRSGRC